MNKVLAWSRVLGKWTRRGLNAACCCRICVILRIFAECAGGWCLPSVKCNIVIEKSYMT